MAEKVVMPKMGATMESGTILRWFKEEGDQVVAGEPLLEILTDKISMELEAEISGILLKVYSGPDEVVPVHQVIAYIGEEGENIPDSPGSPTMKSLDSIPSQQEEGERDLRLNLKDQGSIPNKLRRTPAARKLAQAKGIDLYLVKGSGANGRIHRKDVEAYIQAQQQVQVKATPLARKIAEEQQIDLTVVQGTGTNGKIVRQDVWKERQEIQELPAHDQIPSAKKRMKVEGIRKVIGQRMLQSTTTIPHVTIVTEVDMTRCKELRNELLAMIEKQTGCRLSYTEIFVKFVASALRRHPKLNATLKDDYVVFNPEVNIGLAVSIDEGLLVPVIKNADQKGLQALVEECKGLRSLALESRLKPDQLTGGTFTISNLGMYAIDAFTPIINPPESAILGVGRIGEKPVGISGQIELRPMVTLSLSFDHRIIDGAPAAAFLTDLKELLENPYQIMA